jgi:hypothetical protein
MENDRALKAASLLELVASGQMNPTSALNEWPDIDSEPDDLISASWHDLSHYENDVDIRKRDSRFEAKMREGLKNQAAKIRKKYNLLP